MVLEAPIIKKSGDSKKPEKIVLGTQSKADRAEWMKACDAQITIDDDAQHLVEGTGDLISQFDFDVTMPAGPKGKPATLTVTREHVQIFQKGNLLSAPS